MDEKQGTQGKPSKFAEQNEHAAERKAETVRESEKVEEPKQDTKVNPDTTEKTK